MLNKNSLFSQLVMHVNLVIMHIFGYNNPAHAPIMKQAMICADESMCPGITRLAGVTI